MRAAARPTLREGSHPTVASPWAYRRVPKLLTGRAVCREITGAALGAAKGLAALVPAPGRLGGKDSRCGVMAQTKGSHQFRTPGTLLLSASRWWTLNATRWSWRSSLLRSLSCNWRAPRSGGPSPGPCRGDWWSRCGLAGSRVLQQFSSPGSDTPPRGPMERKRLTGKNVQAWLSLTYVSLSCAYLVKTGWQRPLPMKTGRARIRCTCRDRRPEP